MCSAGSATTFRIPNMLFKGTKFQISTKPRIAYDRLLGVGYSWSNPNGNVYISILSTGSQFGELIKIRKASLSKLAFTFLTIFGLQALPSVSTTNCIITLPVI